MTSSRYLYHSTRWTDFKERMHSIKSNKGCVDCGIKDHRVLQFHHIDGKQFNIMRMYGHSAIRVREELNRCELLCANCHAIRHYGDENGN